MQETHELLKRVVETLHPEQTLDPLQKSQSLIVHGMHRLRRRENPRAHYWQMLVELHVMQLVIRQVTH